VLGFKPTKIKNSDYWYLSPFRGEKEPSFKANRLKNVWYDHGLGKGGKTIDFAMEYFSCGVSGALNKLSLFHQQQNVEHPSVGGQFSQGKTIQEDVANSIKIVAVRDAITDRSLCEYIQNRKVSEEIANTYCREVDYTLNNKVYTAIGFKNSAGGYELRNQYFKGSSASKYVTYLDNDADKIAVFEGFFDFLTYQTINQRTTENLSNFLVLNSLAFFERSLLLLEKHGQIHLYLDHDNSGRKCTQSAKERSLKYRDASSFYKGYKDLNDWKMKAHLTEKKQKSLRM
jgi:hypothetical protein